MLTNKRTLNVLYTKDRTLTIGDRLQSDLVVKTATLDEVQKELDVTDLSSLPDGFVAGWASTNSLDHYGDIIQAGAFQESINEKGLKGPRGIKLLNQHRSSEPAGVITKLEQRSGGLWMEAQLNLNISYVKDTYEASKMQGGLNFSVGYRLLEGGFKFVEKGDESHWLISKADLHEVSVVTFPGNDDAEMLFIKNGPEQDPFDTIAEAEKALVASGFAKSRNEAQRFTRWVKNLALKAAPEPKPVQADNESFDSINKSLKDLKTLFKN